MIHRIRSVVTARFVNLLKSISLKMLLVTSEKEEAKLKRLDIPTVKISQNGRCLFSILHANNMTSTRAMRTVDNVQF